MPLLVQREMIRRVKKSWAVIGVATISHGGYLEGAGYWCYGIFGEPYC